jgi:hypothetical protein
LPDATPQDDDNIIAATVDKEFFGKEPINLGYKIMAFSRFVEKTALTHQVSQSKKTLAAQFDGVAAYAYVYTRSCHHFYVQSISTLSATV